MVIVFVATLHPLFTEISTTFVPCWRFKLALTLFAEKLNPVIGCPFNVNWIWFTFETLATLKETFCEAFVVVVEFPDGDPNVMVASLHLEIE